MSRQLEEFGLQIIAGGLVDQPVGMLRDVMTTRSYCRAYDAYSNPTDREKGPPQWAIDAVLPIEARAVLGEEFEG